MATRRPKASSKGRPAAPGKPAAKTPKGAEGRASRAGQADVLTLTELEQVRVLADPLRVRIIEQLCDKEQTTKQVADRLGEKPTKLYHHVEALEKVGLIRQTRTARNRGTLERYYLAVARAFKADATLFAGDDAARAESEETVASMVSTIFQTTAQEVNELNRRCVLRGEDLTEEGVISFLHVETDEKTVARITRRLHRLLGDLQSIDKQTERGPRRPYRLTLAFYPLEAPTDRDDEASG